MAKKYTMQLNGQPLEVEIGKVAKQANGACLVCHGESVVLVTATASTKAKEGVDFLPLSCDYEEKMYSSGKIPGGFNKREGRPSNDAILVSRLIDRPIRPLFPEDYHHSLSVMATVLSYDPNYPTDILAMIGSSIALSISDIPFQGPTGSIRVGYKDGEYILNPSVDAQKESKLNLVVSGTDKAIMMVEAAVDLLDEEQVLKAILLAHEEIKKIVAFVNEITSEIGKEKQIVEAFDVPENVEKFMRDSVYDLVTNALNIADKMEQGHELSRIKDEFIAKCEEDEVEIDEFTIGYIFEKFTQEAFRKQILVDKRRSDGRSFTQIRPLSSEVGLLPRTHGSGLFTRGQTQALSVVTLAGLGDGQIIDGLDPEYTKRYVHHYNFPPFSVGESRPPRSPGRREIGHGNLAERALIPVLPTADEFPYFIRVVSEVLESNGSSSQASICGSTLSLMDAGVPIQNPVAGIAMGLIKDEGDPVILTDIQGLEDHYGDMDFKVAGTADAITALQMDIKIDGVDENILRTALKQAKEARLEILDHLHGTIEAPRSELSKYAPMITTLLIDPDKIGEVIGSGGKTIHKIVDETGANIEIEDDGRVSIIASDMESGNRAKQIVSEIVNEIKEGDIYKGKVTKIVNFGAFVEVQWGKEGLLHISQLEHRRVENVEDVLKEGDIVEVKVIGLDKGKISLSRKALLPKPERQEKKSEEQ
ncbi:polyribonucleotide nucleotidyltransferase [Peptoniphilus sp. KCTC 25270]|uniref:polyribonucleotide nucleotidyltransferase n=1 Tax=Peptoniphilus sp. KCTC 25270 TaxID=2897414 RepID=UPI001E5421EC|nr:polyribonucleotide nucleotidyltransferase [Peptoniphilus sp. KCTC 25270]MCD1146995.1 polyribonucleotide nucleotidyltransferase [Peptoniphilus sp. KCTC 25270]